MQNLKYVIANFFTNGEYLVSPELIPGTLFTPLHIVFESIFIFLIVISAIYIGKRKELIKPVFKVLFFTLLALEAAIIIWDSISGPIKGLNFKSGLSLYPCSIFMLALPLIIWGRGIFKKAAYGYVLTLGLLGALVNLIYPYRLTTYSCISFPAMHSMFYHGAMFFGYLVILISKEHTYINITKINELFYPCILPMLYSIPANILNYSPLNSDYMYFKGQYPVIHHFFSSVASIKITIVIYLLYIFVPVLFYLPGYIIYGYKYNRVKIHFYKIIHNVKQKLSLKI